MDNKQVMLVKLGSNYNDLEESAYSAKITMVILQLTIEKMKLIIQV